MTDLTFPTPEGGNAVTHLLFDWGDTLMADCPERPEPMADWPHVAACDGVAEALPLLAESFTCAVASNCTASDAALMQKAFARVGLAQYFAQFITSKELGARKPDAAFFHRAAAQLGCAPADICMIGNSYANDIAGAKQAGMTTVLLTGEEGAYPLADHVIPCFDALLDVLLPGDGGAG
ncbi:MAG: HAD family hydrolase [Oscillospiraceae bacterium]|jgi:putative hydrolase of the HAD superfamily|nr:HAD family hydrolase [Oscillospiraceae bacterium]